ncbi:hypothetical protein OG21DRAFT_1523203 [Imleria badia]|nr:hypothetical protein OG21DRAFT_1523203 [Imleria badia]
MDTSNPRNPLFQQDLFLCILDGLVEVVAPDSETSVPRLALASLAQTCRGFSEPSLDRLWSKLDSLEPLIRCFVTVLDEERAKTPPSPAEWAVIHRYSHRIRELTIEGRFTLFFLRATSLHPSLLVPNLRALRWHPYCNHFPRSQPGFSIIFIHRLLSPSLVPLNVTLSDSDDVTFHSFLANYPFLCSNLKSVVINNIGGNEQTSNTIINALSQAITYHKRLERLTISAPINDVALMHVAMSPKVKKLSLVLHPVRSNLHRVCIPSEITPFRNVEELSLEVWDVYHVTTLLRNQDQMFRSVWLCYYSLPTTKAVSALLTALVSRHRARSLRSLTLSPDPLDVERQHFTPVASNESTMRHHISYDTLRPLSSLCHLRELFIDLCHWLSIDDDDLVSLTRNWPFLHALQLNCEREYVYDHPWRSAKYIPFNGLLSLLGCCPDLRRLSLPLDARMVPVDTGDIVCNPSLIYLHFFESPISHAHSVQDFLTLHFPSVAQVWFSFKLSPGEVDVEIELYNALWDTVNSHLYEIHYKDDSDS